MISSVPPVESKKLELKQRYYKVDISYFNIGINVQLQIWLCLIWLGTWMNDVKIKKWITYCKPSIIHCLLAGSSYMMSEVDCDWEIFSCQKLRLNRKYGWHIRIHTPSTFRDGNLGELKSLSAISRFPVRICWLIDSILYTTLSSC